MSIVMERVGLLTDLEKDWTELEERSEPSFFTSWLWIGTWLETLPKEIKPYIVRVKNKEKIIGLAIFIKKEIKRNKIIKSNALLMNTTGDPEFDEITMEYNSFITDKSQEDECNKNLVTYLEQSCSEYDEIYFDGCINFQLKSLLTNNDMSEKINAVQNCYVVNLGEINAENAEYMDKISSNTRYQIRRSIKAYEREGELKIEAADSKQKANDYLNGLRDLHQSYWEEKGEPGSFSNKYFSLFHDTLINKKFDPRFIQLLKISAGDKIIGYLYNYRYRGNIYNYQSGFNYGIVKKYNKPGLVSHYLAINHYKEANEKVYEFMAGEVQYKKSMSTEVKNMEWIVLQKNKMKFTLETALKSIKKSIFNT